MKSSTKILIVEDDATSRDALSILLQGNGYAVTGCSAGEQGLELLRREQCDIVISDLVLPDMSGLEVLSRIKESFPRTEVVMVTGHASAETAVQAMKKGAFDYITKPLNLDELRIILAKAVEKKVLLKENGYLRKQLRERYEFASIIGNSRAMQLLFSRMKRIIQTDSTVLILGESGTGKELVAKAIHYNGRRKDKPFVAVNCSAIPENLLESELFGHVKGAFTGALKEKVGKFEAANQGTILLDEIGTLPMHLQTKLLRVLQEQELERVGSNKQIKLDVRVISATNVNLEEEVRRGNFREDLFYRLNVIPLQIPPLRERTEDILPLATHFLEKNCRTMGRQLMHLDKEALEALEAYPWQGNVRELENIIERIVALSEGDVISLRDLPANVTRSYLEGSPTAVTPAGIDMVQTINEIEKRMIAEALQLAGGVKARAAIMLNINRTTLVEKMRRLGMPL
ncbi:sigma-54 dependent transcriptional regulator [Geomonas sp.]|uniref:sigma-54-dependent transcriptional regulator n=1 Tax=Geomonas sp. TaxID=2651584 RepID=UPI002B4849CB|nr:sigma-54 dependent transcriptional regulator [Geomonas sp.]HJV35142.1 sigma-54 dependent transcriptional regulator [Geomonas sp.]